MDSSSSERRQHPRLAVASSAIVLARHNSGVAFSIESISVGGARLVGPLTLEAGESIQILFELEGTPIDVEGRVVRVDRQDLATDRVAVAFKNLSEEARVSIQQLVLRGLDLESELMIEE